MPKSFAEKRKMLKGVRGFLHRHPRTAHAAAGAAIGGVLGGAQSEHHGKKFSKKQRLKNALISGSIYAGGGAVIGNLRDAGRVSGRAHRRTMSQVKKDYAQHGKELQESFRASVRPELRRDRAEGDVSDVLEHVNKGRKKGEKFFPQNPSNKDMEKKNAAQDEYLTVAMSAMFEELENPTFEPTNIPDGLAKQASVMVAAFFEELSR
jgi:hypothetical protein